MLVNETDGEAFESDVDATAAAPSSRMAVAVDDVSVVLALCFLSPELFDLGELSPAEEEAAFFN